MFGFGHFFDKIRTMIIPAFISTTEGEWENQGRIFWENITTVWEDIITVIGTYRYWNEQTKEFWQLESTINWEDWYETQGSLLMIEEKTTNWDAETTNWENFE